MSVSRAVATARLFAQRARLPAPTADSLAILVEEWMANIVEHGGADPRSLITLRMEPLGEGARLSISDAGVAFDPRRFTMQGPNAVRGGGAGIAMIRAWSRIADYRRSGGRNRLVLEIPPDMGGRA